MKDEGYFQFSLGQIITAAITLIVMGIVIFYVGARFGPKLMWGIEIDVAGQNALLPNEIPEEELKRLVEEHNDQFKLTFYDELEKEKASANLDIKDSAEPFKTLPEEENKPEEVKLEEKSSEKVAQAQPGEEKKPEEKAPEKIAQVKPVEVKKPEMKTSDVKVPEPVLKKEEPVLVKPIQETTSPVAEAPLEVPAEPETKKYTLHVGSYTDLKKLEKMEERLNKGGYKTIRRTTKSSSGEMIYVLEIGQYPSPDVAEKTRDNIRKNFMVVGQVVEK